MVHVAREVEGQVLLEHAHTAERAAGALAEACTPDNALLDELSIAPGWMQRFPNELSGGEQERGP